MIGARLTIMGLILALCAILTPLGLLLLRAGGWTSLMWVFGLWALLVIFAAVSSWRALKGDQETEQ